MVLVGTFGKFWNCLVLFGKCMTATVVFFIQRSNNYPNILVFYRTQVNLGSDLWVRMSLRPRHCVDFTDVTLADEDTNSILTGNANQAFQCNVAMKVTEAGGKICN